MLEFFSGSFYGGIDVDELFNCVFVWLNEVEWSNVDILFVIDGEIKFFDEILIVNFNEVKEEMGLKVYGLFVGDVGNVEVVELICIYVYVFKFWIVVGGKLL